MDGRDSIPASGHYTTQTERESWDQELDYLKETHTWHRRRAGIPVSLANCESTKYGLSGTVERFIVEFQRYPHEIHTGYGAITLAVRLGVN